MLLILKAGDKMSSIISQISDVFGYHSMNTAKESVVFQKNTLNERIRDDQKDYLVYNLLNGVGYFPLASLASGGARSYIAYMELEQEPEHKVFYAVQLARGVVEMFCLGFLFAIPDLIVSIGRHLSYFIRHADPLSASISQVFDAFGYHSQNTATKSGVMHLREEADGYVFDILNGFGYFPLIGSISGIFHLMMGIQGLREDSAHKWFYAITITRGVAEVFCVGFVFAIPDLIVSIGRYIRNSVAPQPLTAI